MKRQKCASSFVKRDSQWSVPLCVGSPLDSFCSVVVWHWIHDCCFDQKAKGKAASGGEWHKKGWKKEERDLLLQVFSSPVRPLMTSSSCSLHFTHYCSSFLMLLLHETKGSAASQGHTVMSTQIHTQKRRRDSQVRGSKREIKEHRNCVARRKRDLEKWKKGKKSHGGRRGWHKHWSIRNMKQGV